MGNLDKSDNYTYYKEAIAKGFKQEVSMYYMWDFFMHDKDFAISKEKQNNDNQVQRGDIIVVASTCCWIEINW